MVDVKQVADAADMIVNGYAFFSDGVILIRKNIRAEITFQRWSNLDSKEYSGKGLLFGDGVILI